MAPGVRKDLEAPSRASCLITTSAGSAWLPRATPSLLPWEHEAPWAMPAPTKRKEPLPREGTMRPCTRGSPHLPPQVLGGLTSDRAADKSGLYIQNRGH